MGQCCESQEKNNNNNFPQVYFIKDENEYMFQCNQDESMRNVIERFCSQLKINKKHYLFIHNNNLIKENSTYNMLVPGRDNKRIITVTRGPNEAEISSRGSKDIKLLNMESIVSKINNPNIIKEDYKNYYIDEGVISDEDYYKIHKASRMNTYEKFAIKVFDFNNIISDYKNDNLTDPNQKDMEAFVQGLIEQVKNMLILGQQNINSVQLYQCFLTKNEFAIVMELCDTDLMKKFCSQNAFSLQEVRGILNQLNNTFRIMANNNIIHGDLKLDNILVKYINSNKNSYILKLTDYGVSNKFMLDICTKFRAKTAIGENTSPEMLISKDNYGQECDLWSLGILIHLLLTKNYPYPGNSDKEILNNIYKNGMRSIVKTGNNEFDHLLRRLLTKNPKDRLTWNEYFSHPFFTGGDYWKFYSKEKQLGKGLYYTVWKCQNINRREYRAIKIIDFKSIQSAFSKQYLRYPTEQDMKVYINHLITETENMELIGGQNEVNINTVKFYEYFITKNDFAIVMELCDTDLKKLSIAKNKTFTPEEIYGILTQLNNTFKIMAKYNLIHRDIKLENILVKYNGYSNSNPTFKLTGYELSKQILNLVEKFHGKIGDYKYMAPEILKGEPFNQECDLWSLGVCIYLLCFKKYPFEGNTQDQVLKEIDKNPPEYLLKTNNQSLNSLISGLLNKDPRKRMTWNEYFNSPFFQKYGRY